MGSISQALGINFSTGTVRLTVVYHGSHAVGDAHETRIFLVLGFRPLRVVRHAERCLEHASQLLRASRRAGRETLTIQKLT